jgi:hypothetical protein
MGVCSNQFTPVRLPKMKFHKLFRKLSEYAFDTSQVVLDSSKSPPRPLGGVALCSRSAGRNISLASSVALLREIILKR